MADGLLNEAGLRNEVLSSEIEKLAGEVGAARGFTTLGEKSAGLPKAIKQKILETLLG